jgi:hypothetical protein
MRAQVLRNQGLIALFYFDLCSEIAVLEVVNCKVERVRDALLSLMHRGFTLALIDSRFANEVKGFGIAGFYHINVGAVLIYGHRALHSIGYYSHMGVVISIERD